MGFIRVRIRLRFECDCQCSHQRKRTKRIHIYFFFFLLLFRSLKFLWRRMQVPDLNRMQLNHEKAKEKKIITLFAAGLHFFSMDSNYTCVRLLAHSHRRPVHGCVLCVYSPLHVYACRMKGNTKHSPNMIWLQNSCSDDWMRSRAHRFGHSAIAFVQISIILWSKFSLCPNL